MVILDKFDCIYIFGIVWVDNSPDWKQPWGTINNFPHFFSSLSLHSNTPSRKNCTPSFFLNVKIIFLMMVRKDKEEFWLIFLIYIKSNVFWRKPGDDGDVCRGLLSIIIYKMKRAIHNYNTSDHDAQAHNSIKEKTKTNCGIVALIVLARLL